MMLNGFPEGLNGLSEKRTRVRRPVCAESEDSMFRALLAALLSLSLACCSATNCMGGSIVYNIQNYAYLQNGFTLSGTITTDGTIGTLTSADITAWSFSVTGPMSYQLTSQNPGAFLFVSNLTASSTALSLAHTNTIGLIEGLTLVGPQLTAFPTLSYQRIPGADVYTSFGDQGANSWSDFAPSPPGLSLGGSTWIIATTATIPEPGTLTLTLLGGACIGAVQWMQRCRRAVSGSDR
jgi:hypothetical protein